VARAIFKRWNPGAAKDWSVKVLIVARAIFKRRNPGAAEDGGLKVLNEGLCSKKQAPHHHHNHHRHHQRRRTTKAFSSEYLHPWPAS